MPCHLRCVEVALWLGYAPSGLFVGGEIWFVGANDVLVNLNLAGINVDAVRVLQLAWAVVWSISKLPDAGF